MADKKTYKQFLYHITENDYHKANQCLEALFEAKLRNRINVSIQRVDEGLFDRLGAKASGFTAGLKTKAQNIGTRVGSAAKAVGQNIVGAATGQGFSAGQATVDAANKQIAGNDPRKAAKAAKADSIIASMEKDLSTLYPNINVKNALAKLRAQLNFSKP